MVTGASQRFASLPALEVEMHLNDPSVYMRMRGYPATVVLECAACPTHFKAKDGVAFPAIQKDGDVVMAAFCCGRCYLQAMPIKIMWRA
jgi:hypothetical protein